MNSLGWLNWYQKKTVSYDFSLEDIQSHFDNAQGHLFFKTLIKKTNWGTKTIEEVKQIMDAINEQVKKEWFEKSMDKNMKIIGNDVNRINTRKIVNLVETYYRSKKRINAKNRQENNVTDTEKKLKYTLPIALVNEDPDKVKEFLETETSKDWYKFISSRLKKEIRMRLFYNFWEIVKEQREWELIQEGDEERIFVNVYSYLFGTLDPQKKYLEENKEVIFAFKKLFEKAEADYQNILDEIAIMSEMEKQELIESLEDDDWRIPYLDEENNNGDLLYLTPDHSESRWRDETDEERQERLIKEAEQEVEEEKKTKKEKKAREILRQKKSHHKNQKDNWMGSLFNGIE